MRGDALNVPPLAHHRSPYFLLSDTMNLQNRTQEGDQFRRWDCARHSRKYSTAICAIALKSSTMYAGIRPSAAAASNSFQASSPVCVFGRCIWQPRSINRTASSDTSISATKPVARLFKVISNLQSALWHGEPEFWNTKATWCLKHAVTKLPLPGISTGVEGDAMFRQGMTSVW